MPQPNTPPPPCYPAETFAEEVVGVPFRTFEQLVSEGHGPRMFLLGRRRYVMSSDGIAWLELMRDRFPYCPKTG